MIQTFWLVKSHRNFPSLVLRFKDHNSKKSPEKVKSKPHPFSIYARKLFTKEVEASNGNHQVEVGAIEAATGHPSQPEQEAEAEESVEAGGEGAAAGLLREQGDHAEAEATHMSVSAQSTLSSLVWSSPNMD